MQILIALLILLAIIPGLPNSLDWFAYRLHLVAKTIRAIQHRLTCTMEEIWVKELEKGKPNLEVEKYMPTRVGGYWRDH